MPKDGKSKLEDRGSKKSRKSSQVADEAEEHPQKSKKVKIEAESKGEDEEESHLVDTKVDFKIGQKYPTPAPGTVTIRYFQDYKFEFKSHRRQWG